MSDVDLLLTHSRELQQLQHALNKLDLRWEVIETTAQILSPASAGGFLSTLRDTRQRFGDLSTQLIERMAKAQLDNVRLDLRGRAQSAIDVLTRNLYERTADVGFIATDRALIDALTDPTPQRLTALRERLGQYQAKYTVYKDLLLLDAQGLELARLGQPLDERSPLPGWNELLQRDGYQERWCESALLHGQGRQLFYLHRICDGGQALGAVLLHFDVAGEMQALFEEVVGDEEALDVVLVDADGLVVGSAHPRFEPGRRVERVASSDSGLAHWQGHDHLLAEGVARPYQGYPGPGWRALAAVRVDLALRRGTEAGQTALRTQLNDDHLTRIVAQAQRIEYALRQVIWNGKLGDHDSAQDHTLHALFDQIQSAGQASTLVFSDAIERLSHLVAQGRGAQIARHARLAASFMDRNLYERANDCRWWALSPELRQALHRWQAHPQDAQARDDARSVLAHLNQLYTVYRRVALFDTQGRIVAVSRDEQTLPSDLQLAPDLLQRVGALRDDQAYAVSPFRSDPLSDGAESYVFSAAIRGDDGRWLGGVALAFDAAQELDAMLRDALPQLEDVGGVFVCPQGSVMAQAGEAFAATGLPPQPRERATSGTHSAKGLCLWWADTPGYREFKRSDGYAEVPRAVLHLPAAGEIDKESAPPVSRQESGHAVRLAVVRCHGHLVGVPAAQVASAQRAIRRVRLPGGDGRSGLALVPGAEGEQVLPWVTLPGMPARSPETQDQDEGVMVILRSGPRVVALEVDSLVAVIERDDVQSAPSAVQCHCPWISGVVSLKDGVGGILYVMDADQLATGPAETAGLLVDVLASTPESTPEAPTGAAPDATAPEIAPLPAQASHADLARRDTLAEGAMVGGG